MATPTLKYTEGPTAEEWEHHRETITQLYYRMSLKELSDFMKQRHRFHASKRMYDSRFRRWQVFKTSKKGDPRRAASSTKDHASTALDAARRARSKSAEQKRRDLAPKLSPDRDNQFPKYPLTRHGPIAVKTERQSPDIFTPARSSRNSPDAEIIATPPVLYAPNDDTKYSTLPSRFHAITAMPSPPLSSTSSPIVPSDYPEDTVRTSSSVASVPSNRTRSRVSPLHLSQMINHTESPQRLLSPPTLTRKMEMILQNITAFYDWKLNTMHRDTPVSSPTQLFNAADALQVEYLWSTPASDNFWRNINTGVYLLKYEQDLTHRGCRPDRAFTAIQEGCTNVSDALSIVPFDFPLQLLVRLSPNKTKVCLPLRSSLLSYLTDMCKTRLGANHPVTVICDSLLNDEHCEEISEQGFRYIAQIFHERLGSCPAIKFKIALAQIKWRRRSNDLQGLTAQVEDLLSTSQRIFGPTDARTRTAASELAHVYMRTGQYDRALILSMTAIQPPTVRHVKAESNPASPQDPQSIGEATWFSDEIAEYAMEDMAEIYARRGNLVSSMWWMERAANLARELWGTNPATLHIVDKLVALMREHGRDDEARVWEEWASPRGPVSPGASRTRRSEQTAASMCPRVVELDSSSS